MSKLDNELIKATGITATAIGKYLNVSPQSISNGIRAKKNYISETKIAKLQDILQKEGELDILQKLNRFLQSQEQTPMHRFSSDHQPDCFVNVRTSEFKENVDWIVRDYSSNNLKSDLVILTPDIEEIKQSIVSKGLREMPVEKAREGINHNITIVNSGELLSPTLYIEGNACFVLSQSNSFVELPKDDSFRIKKCVQLEIEGSPLLVKQWSSLVVPYIILLKEVKNMLSADSGELLTELTNFFQNNNACIDAINWKSLALRLQPEKKPYQCSSITPYDQLLDFVSYISDSVEGSMDFLVVKEADDIKRCLKAVKLI